MTQRDANPGMRKKNVPEVSEGHSSVGPYPILDFILENAVETTDSTDGHGYSIKYKFVMIHPEGEGVFMSFYKYFFLNLSSVSVVISEIRG
jgi:hypothetical protein